ncbi:MAG: ABC transporter substrate-binding protein, partial [Candidatus Heimdallarchaeota archaeon]|nr:ABC transporter substrate-binding protein [Candidatus Heimdallarchaeota archaeon]
MAKKSKSIILIVLILVILCQSIFISHSSPLEFGMTIPEKSKKIPTEARSFSSESEVSIPRILKIGSVYVPINYDPLTALYGVEIQRNSLIYDTLLEFNVETGKLSPALAKQWLVSTDSRHWIFYLRDDVFFHDGSKFNSTVVKYNFDRILDQTHPAYQDPILANLGYFPLESVEIISDFIVVINFKESYAPFINNELPLKFQMISPSSFNTLGDLETPFGTGPYMLDFHTSNDTFHNFTRFQNHFRGTAPFEEVHYTAFNESSPEFFSKIESQELDFLPLFFPEEIESDDYWNIIQTKESNIHLLGYFNYENPILVNRNVRQAINYAINKQDIVDTHFSGFGEPMNTLIPSSVNIGNESYPGYPFNISYANFLLDSSGFLKDSDGYRFSLDLSGLTLLTDYNDLLNTIRNNLELVGIQINILEHNNYE